MKRNIIINHLYEQHSPDIVSKVQYLTPGSRSNVLARVGFE